MQYSHKLFNYLLTLPLLSIVPLAHAEVDGSMAFAIDSIWNVERPSISVLSSDFSSKASKAGTAYRARMSNSPTYLISGEEGASLIYGSKRFNATTTPWGTFPRVDIQKTRLLEMTIPKRHYLLFVGPGKGVFSAGNWQRYTFLHVVDTSNPSAPVYYPLLSDAYLGERVLGRLPGSPVLNYARLVPTEQANAYEVTIYALKSKGPERVIKHGTPVAYSLIRKGETWDITSISSTPITDAQDKAGRPFTAPSLFASAPATPKERDKK